MLRIMFSSKDYYDGTKYMVGAFNKAIDKVEKERQGASSEVIVSKETEFERRERWKCRRISTAEYVPCFHDFYTHLKISCSEVPLDVRYGVTPQGMVTDYDSSSMKASYVKLEHASVVEVLETSHVGVFGLEGIFSSVFLSRIRPELNGVPWAAALSGQDRLTRLVSQDTNVSLAMNNGQKVYYPQPMSPLETDILKMANEWRHDLAFLVNKRVPSKEYWAPVLDSMLITLGDSKGCGFELHSDAGTDNTDDNLISLNEQLHRTEFLDTKNLETITFFFSLTLQNE